MELTFALTGTPKADQYLQTIVNAAASLDSGGVLALLQGQKAQMAEAVRRLTQSIDDDEDHGFEGDGVTLNLVISQLEMWTVEAQAESA